MKSKQVYGQWIDDVEAQWTSLGLSRLPGGGCKWQSDVGELTLLLYVEVDRKYPWTVQGGGNFSINAYLPATRPEHPENYVESVFDSVAFFSLWGDELKERRLELNREVYEKIRNLDKTELYAKMADAYDCTPAQAKQSGLYQTELEIIAMDVDDPVDALINPPLYFYDEDDVSAWAELVTAAMPQVLANVSNDMPRVFDAGETT